MSANPPQPAGNHTPNYGFVIDNRKCIGCHACTTACKSENEVPLGVNRTWVKYVETGRFPNTRRHFQVTRCNHCANPPCVRICPTAAMYQRADGIVEFDPAICIGCKACMQACPYDAIYIDPETNTAAKCHYCAHRTDIGLEPACVVVCPEHAIIAGDLNDPNSEIAHILARHEVTVRKPEQGTAPKLFYIDGHAAALHPTATERAPETFLWADVIPLHKNDRPGNHSQSVSPPSATNTGRRPPQQQALPAGGPIHIGGTMAEQMVQVAYNAQHKIPWHWPVPAYLVTKAIAAGLFMLLAAGWAFNLFPYDSLTAVAAGLTTLIFMLLTTGFLVLDLDRPERFLYILIRPQWNSWLARGAMFLIGFSAIAGLWWSFELLAFLNIPAGFTVPLGNLWLVAGFIPAAGVAIYTAFLFAQAEGRDLWQSTLLPFHLLVQAVVAGSAALLVLDLFLPIPDETGRATVTIFVLALALNLFVTLAGEFGIPHATDTAAKAAHEISHGRYRRHFWLGGLGLGHVLPFVLILGGLFVAALEVPAFFLPLIFCISGLCAIAGLYLYEVAFVMAPQEIPNS